MMTVIKKPLTPNIVWDTETNKPLCKFNKGVFQTNDKVIADKLAALGHKVTGEVDGVEEEKTEASDETEVNGEGNVTSDETESNDENNKISASDDNEQNTVNKPKEDKTTKSRKNGK